RRAVDGPAPDRERRRSAHRDRAAEDVRDERRDERELARDRDHSRRADVRAVREGRVRQRARQGAVDVRRLGGDQASVLGDHRGVAWCGPRRRVQGGEAGRLADRIRQADPADEHATEIDPEQDHQQHDGQADRELDQALAAAAVTPPARRRARRSSRWNGFPLYRHDEAPRPLVTDGSPPRSADPCDQGFAHYRGSDLAKNLANGTFGYPVRTGVWPACTGARIRRTTIDDAAME